MYVSESVCVYAMCVGDHRVQKSLWDPLKLKLPTVVSQRVDAGN